MSFLGKNYIFVKQENFDGFLKFIGCSDDMVEKFLKFSLDHKLMKDGDTYTYHTTTPEGLKEIKFKSGVEFDDIIGTETPVNIPIKATFTVVGNTVTLTLKAEPDYGVATVKREYNGDDLVVTITWDKWDGVAKRFYKAA